MAAWKRRREDTCTQEAPASPAPTEWMLPTDLLLEIVARSDTHTLLRCASTCKILRRDILDPSFICRVTKDGAILPSRLLIAFLPNGDIRNGDDSLLPQLVTLLHPATPAASRFTDDILVPYMSPRATSLLRQYEPITSCGGLILLRRRSSADEPCSALCVYNPMSADCTYLSNPPGLSKRWYSLRHVLLTSTDGIDSSFMLLAFEVGLYNKTSTCGNRVQTASSSSNTGGTNWGPVSCLPFLPLERGDDSIAVLYGGVIHWLLQDDDDKILTYDVRIHKLGTMKLPPTNNDGWQRILGMSPDGKLRFFVADRLLISVWILLSDGWVPEVVIDAEEKLRSLCPPGPVLTVLHRSWERSNVVLLRLYSSHGKQDGRLIVFDFETKEMRIKDSHPSLLFEVDLPTRIQAMRIFS